MEIIAYFTRICNVVFCLWVKSTRCQYRLRWWFGPMLIKSHYVVWRHKSFVSYGWPLWLRSKCRLGLWLVCHLQLFSYAKQITWYIILSENIVPVLLSQSSLCSNSIHIAFTLDIFINIYCGFGIVVQSTSVFSWCALYWKMIPIGLLTKL